MRAKSSDIGKSAARFDLKKLQFLSGQHLKNSDDAALLHETLKFLTKVKKQSLSEDKIQLLNQGLYCLKDRVKTLPKVLAKFDLKIHETGGAVVFTYNKNANRTGITRMLSALSENNLIVTDLKTHQSTLEDVFLSFISKVSK